jgi:hypothetical protein
VLALECPGFHVSHLLWNFTPVLDDYVKATKEKNLPGEEALKFCQEWLKQNP